MTTTKYSQEELVKLLEDPNQLQHIGLLYWINTAVRQIGCGPVISLMCSYMANIISKTLDTPEEKEEALVLIAQSIRNSVSLEDAETTPKSTDVEEDLTNILNNLKKNTDEDLN